jgi:hypothetical protein
MLFACIGWLCHRYQHIWLFHLYRTDEKRARSDADIRVVEAKEWANADSADTTHASSTLALGVGHNMVTVPLPVVIAPSVVTEVNAVNSLINREMNMKRRKAEWAQRQRDIENVDNNETD